MENQLQINICKPTILKDLIEYFVIFRGQGVFTSNVYAQPFAYILFNYDYSLEISLQNNQFNSQKSLLEPINLTPFKVNARFDSYSEIFGLKVKPVFLYLYTGIPLNLLTGNIFKIEDVCKHNINILLEQINSVHTLTEKALIAEKFFIGEMKILEKAPLSDNLNVMRFLTHNFFSSNSIDQLIDNLNVSHRTLDRHFLKYTGVSPKTMLSLIRFQKILEYVTAHQALNLGTLWDFGYYDYAHFSKEFKKYSGQTFESFKQEHKIGENLQVTNQKTTILLPEISIY